MDHCRAPLPPCTLESLPEPIELPCSSSSNLDDEDEEEDEFGCWWGSDDEDDFDHDDDAAARRTRRSARRRRRPRRRTTRRRRHEVWPVLLGCYRLEDTSNEGMSEQNRPPQQRRSGQLDLLTIRVPDVTSNDPTLPLRFDNNESSLTTVLDPKTTPGILDAKWSTGGEGTATVSWKPRRYGSSQMFATAHSTGEVRVHALHVLRAREDDDNQPQEDANEVRRRPAATSSPLDVRANVAVASSPTASSSNNGFRSATTQGTACPALCLSLNWKPPSASVLPSQHPELLSSSAQIVSTYSNGVVAIHDLVFASRGSHNGNNDESDPPACQLVTTDCWSAHSLFTSPSEVWSASFVGVCGGNNSTTNSSIATGGDDATLKLWDVRATNRPTTVLKNHFGAGVTCISQHPHLSNVFVAGSYDESVNLYDTRLLSTPLCRKEGLGGGIWRLQWHPLNDRRLLVAAMHGGCIVSQFKGLVPSSSSSSSTSTTTTIHNAAPSFLRPPNEHQPSSWLYPSLSSVPTASFDSTLTETTANSAGGLSGSHDASATPRRIRLRVKKAFEEHASMVYGASWLVCRHPTQPGSYFEAAASCSFYDQNVYVWDSVF